MLALLRQMDDRLSYLQADAASQGHAIKFQFDRDTELNTFFRRCRAESRFFDVSVLLRNDTTSNETKSVPMNSFLLCSVCDVWDKCVQYRSTSETGTKRSRNISGTSEKPASDMELDSAGPSNNGDMVVSEQKTEKNQIDLTHLTCSQFEMILDMWCGTPVHLNSECALKLAVAMESDNISHSLRERITEFVRQNADSLCCAEYVTMPNTDPVSQLRTDMHCFLLANFNDVMQHIKGKLSKKWRKFVLENAMFIESDDNAKTHEYLRNATLDSNNSFQGLNMGLPLNVQQFQKKPYTCILTNGSSDLQVVSDADAQSMRKGIITSMHMYDSRSLLMIIGGREVVVFDVIDSKAVKRKTFGEDEFRGGMAESAMITQDRIYLAMLPHYMDRSGFRPTILVYDNNPAANFLETTRYELHLDPREIRINSCLIEGSSEVLVATIGCNHTSIHCVYVKKNEEYNLSSSRTSHGMCNENGAFVIDSSVFYVHKNTCIRKEKTDGELIAQLVANDIDFRSTCIFLDKIYFCTMAPEPSLICVDKSLNQSTSNTFSTNKPWPGSNGRNTSSQLISSGARLLMYSTYDEAHRLDVFDVRTSCFIQSIRLDLAPMPPSFSPLVSQFWSLSGRLCFWYMRDRARFDVLLPQTQQQKD